MADDLTGRRARRDLHELLAEQCEECGTILTDSTRRVDVVGFAVCTSCALYGRVLRPVHGSDEPW